MVRTSSTVTGSPSSIIRRSSYASRGRISNVPPVLRCMVAPRRRNRPGSMWAGVAGTATSARELAGSRLLGRVVGVLAALELDQLLALALAGPALPEQHLHDPRRLLARDVVAALAG